MADLFEVKVSVKDADYIIQQLGLAVGGKVQEFFTSEVMRMSDPYLPFGSAGSFRAMSYISNGKDSIIYALPYARYHWFGKLMVDPITKKGAFYNPLYGFWSRPNVQKVLTNRDLNYQGSPMRGSRWVERAWIDNKDAIISATEKYAERYVKK